MANKSSPARLMCFGVQLANAFSKNKLLMHTHITLHLEFGALCPALKLSLGLLLRPVRPMYSLLLDSIYLLLMEDGMKVRMNACLFHGLEVTCRGRHGDQSQV